MTMTMMFPTSMHAPAPRQRRTVRPDAVLGAPTDPKRTALLRLLAANGFTAREVENLRGVATDILGALVQTTAPDPALYLAWGEVARRNRMDAAELLDVFRYATLHAMTPDDVGALIAYGKGEALEGGSRRAWLREHMRHGNRIEHVRVWGRLTPAWIVAWYRTHETPSEVPDVVLTEQRLWQYMEAALEHPELPEKVIAHTLTYAPNPYAKAATSGAWLLACWNPAVGRK